MNASSLPDVPDFVALHQGFTTLTPGQKADLRRVAEPDDLLMTPALYRLFPGQRPNAQHLRLAFLLPWCDHAAHSQPLARQLPERNVTEMRVIQIARAEPDADVIQLRRLVMHIKPTVDWNEFGKTLWFWGAHSKRKFVEDFYLAQYATSKGKH
ncbi:MAG: type I-E CRISPR-associated protein Cse2/CasB [Gammaproteobacteria bacterium]|nr:type I-E CRISPR-associated protein Cse2/CasB [Gammaproteobacteria bacterium]MCP5426087.1 type I-E CRISPR-associated protein Cse2/CasB [Gammaproteobacteria bacterium]